MKTNQTQPSNPSHGAFSAIWRTLGLGISLTMIGSTVLAVVFAVALEGCSRVASRIKPGEAHAISADARAPRLLQ
ncbi:MAG: hypothetical protein LAP21_28960 [Acidobacteriia bacterium]|nr:hypothetical protein [Terriglobia bacterium]